MKLTTLLTTSAILVGISTSAMATQSDDTLWSASLEPIPTELLTQTADNSGYASRYSGFYNARFPSRIRATGSKIFVFSPRMRQWAAYSAGGELLKTGRANGGSGYCSELGRPCRSPRGWFRVRSKGSASCVSGKFPLGTGGAPMPYCMFFHGGYAIHGSPYIGKNNTSHGCIRVQTAAAQWLSQNFMNIGTRVLILPY